MEDDLAYEEILLMLDTDPDKADRLSDLGILFGTRFQRFGDVADIDKAISVLDDAVRLTPDGDPDKPGRLSNLGILFGIRFGRFGDLADVERALSANNSAVQLMLDGHPATPGLLNNLGLSYHIRFRRLGDVADIEKAISVLDDAVRLAPDGHANKAGNLNNLGGALQTRFDRFGNIADIERAISVMDDAVRLTPESHPDKSGHLSSLGGALQTRFDRLGDVTDIEKAISVLDHSIRLTPDGDPDKPRRLTNLGTSFGTRFVRLGDVTDIEKAVSVTDDAVRLTPQDHPDKPHRLNNLGNSFHIRFGRRGDVADIDKAISTKENAVRLTPNGHPAKPGYLNNLSLSFAARFERLDNIADISKAISAQEDALRLMPDGDPDKPGYLFNLGILFANRFERLGNIADVDKAISVQDDAVRLLPEDHPNKPGRLTNLGDSFRARFQRLGDVTDIEKAILATNGAVQLTPEDHPDRPNRLRSLGISFQTRFERHGDIIDLEKAISVFDYAVRLTPDGHPQRPGHLSNLGISFGTRFDRLGDVADIDKSIAVLDDAVRLMPDSHPKTSITLNNLGLSLWTRYDRFGDFTDMDKAISVLNNAVRLTAEGHPDKPSRLTNLGISLASRYERLGDVADINHAVLHFSSAARASVGPAVDRFQAAVNWAACTLANGDPSCLDAYRRALDLLPHVAWLGLPMNQRHKELSDIGNVVSDAAVAAIEAEQYDTALEWLEQGRSIVWGQLLQLRTPVDDLRARDPNLADRLVHVSTQLERASTRDIGDQASIEMTMEQAARNHRKLASEWDSLVETARAIPGFEDFLRPKKLSQLTSAARSGPVVVLNVHETRCDALVLVADLDEVIHIPLNRLSLDRVHALQRSLERSLSNAGVRCRDERGTQWVNMQQGGDTEFQKILSELWTCVVNPVLESLAFTISRAEEPPRILWCPTGPLTFLPLHAAGIYGTTEVGTTVAEFVTSSYTPTLTALLEKPPTTGIREVQLLTVTQSSTPGHSSLPSTEKELKCIRQRADSCVLTSLEGAEATVERVIRGMNESSWVHLACHGKQDAANPTKSALILHDGDLELAEIIRMSLPYADFAFLSACQTATGDKQLTEEAIHLAAGMLLAGYRGVIATAWSIKDNDAPIVADEVYAHLFKDGQPDRTRAAHALHYAVQRLREQGAPFVSWVPFIHVGI